MTASDEVNIRKKNRHDRDTADCHNNAVDHGKHKSLGGGLTRFSMIPSAQMEGDHCIDPNAKSNSGSIDKILNR